MLSSPIFARPLSSILARPHHNDETTAQSGSHCFACVSSLHSERHRHHENASQLSLSQCTRAHHVCGHRNINQENRGFPCASLQSPLLLPLPASQPFSPRLPTRSSVTPHRRAGSTRCKC